MFSTSSGSTLAPPPNQASRISPSSASEVARKAKREHVGVVPPARAVGGRRRRTGPRGCRPPCWPRSTRPCRSSMRPPPARRALRPRRARPPRWPTPSRSRSSCGVCAVQDRLMAAALAARSGIASATPVSSSAATAIRIAEAVRRPRSPARAPRPARSPRASRRSRRSSHRKPVGAHVLDQRDQREALVGERVLDARRDLGERLTLDDPLLLQGAQPQRQRAGAYPPERALELAEPATGPRPGPGSPEASTCRTRSPPCGTPDMCYLKPSLSMLAQCFTN